MVSKFSQGNGLFLASGLAFSLLLICDSAGAPHDFSFARQGFAWYVHFAQASIPLYGALGAFLFFFLWLYYASVVFVLGAEAAWAFDQAAIVQGKIHPVLSHCGKKGG
jgi:uncharacterized BrkB/YihY/UPF0761 family membrane protein